MFLGFLLVGMTLAFAVSTTLLKSVADQWDWHTFGMAVGLGLIGYFFNFALLKVSDLGVAAVLASASQVIVVNLLAHFYRGEQLTVLHITGIGFAAIAVVLVMLAAKG